MLDTLQIRNFAIIEELALDFREGLSVMTGETGAGKSILLDALGLVLGGRADKAAVRRNCDRAEVTAVFSLDDLPAVRAWLADQELTDEDSPDECLIRRVVTSEGRSRAFINARGVTLQHLRELGGELVEVHGQHAHHALLRPETQRDLLDAWAAHPDLLSAVRERYEVYDAERHAHRELAEQAAQRESRLEFLRFQAAELADLVDAARESAELTNERNRLAHSDRLKAAAESTLHALYDADASAQSQITAASRAVDGILELAPELNAAAELLREADVLVSEATETVRRFGGELDAEPTRLDELETTLAALRNASRKHATDVEALPALHDRLRAEIKDLADFDQTLAQRAAAVEAAHVALLEAARDLSRSRGDAAQRFATSVTETMRGLGMANGTFSVALESDDGRVGVRGADTIRFDVTTNPGQPPSPLARTASGGELARIALAIKVNLADVSGTPTLVFDEVDSGIGGAVAEIVGKRLRELGAQRQVLCVTHLPQVASSGHHHFQVSKRSMNDVTRTDIVVLDDEERIAEIARMLGGIELTDATLRHASEMLANGSA
ncbi:MAG: DNA repair protein RecN [Pseudomonadota bacterium]